MPSVSLVVCVHCQRDLLERLLQHSAGCYDDLVVVHDGPDEDGVRFLVEQFGGRFFEKPHAYQQEPHWPFAWGVAEHDWVLRLDADEFPSEEMKSWLKRFRQSPEPAENISGYTCIWPLWNGQRMVSKKFPAGRLFLFHNQRVRYFGIPEMGPNPDGQYEAVDFILHHQPKRKSYGLHNVLVRKQAYHWRAVIAQSLLGKPTDLPSWRWESEAWPMMWEKIRRAPLRMAFESLMMEPLRSLRAQWWIDRHLYFEAAVNGALNHALICLKYWQLRRKRDKES
jgi:hypothetical protein